MGNRKVSDISNFLGVWTQSNNGRKKSAMDASYNPITRNCQQFAADLFDFLVGHKKEYLQKVKDVRSLFQSPYDQKYNQMNNSKNNKDDDCKHMDVEEEEPEMNGNESNQTTELSKTS